MGKTNTKEFRCDGSKRGNPCNNLLLKFIDPFKSEVQVKCYKCGTYNILKNGERQNSGRLILDDFSRGRR